MLFLIILFFFGVTLDGASIGLEALFKPDVSISIIHTMYSNNMYQNEISKGPVGELSKGPAYEVSFT